MRVVFVHPDLGLGGAERLVVDAALSLVEKGNEVVIYTGYHDPSRAFRETVDGRLKVVVKGGWVPRSVCGLGHAACAWARTVATATAAAMSEPREAVFFCDQVAAPVPVLRLLFQRTTVFYVHFPDLLLAPKKASKLRRLYRAPLDYLEALCTARADVLLANSRFTAQVFRKTFPSIKKPLNILYPCVEVPSPGPRPEHPFGGRPYALSLNRYERKKRIDLAVDALRVIQTERGATPLLVIAGGYDPRLAENVEHAEELADLARGMDVVFERSVSDARRKALLANASCLLYTPPDEHFGIVPLEAMALGCPVVACDSGGPRETVQIDPAAGQTGFLVPPTPAAFANALTTILDDPTLAAKLAHNGPNHVRLRFARSVLGQRLHDAISNSSSSSLKQ